MEGFISLAKRKLQFNALLKLAPATPLYNTLFFNLIINT